MLFVGDQGYGDLYAGLRAGARTLRVSPYPADDEGLWDACIRTQEELKELLAALHKLFQIEKGAEITVECNPDSVDLRALRTLRKAGVNRLSLGMQSAQAEELAGQGKTPLYFADESRVLGLIAVADTPKPTSAAAVDAFRQLGLEVVMLTGDNQRTAGAIGAQLGVSQVMAEVLPQDKERKVKQLQDQGKKVAMVGDGINDSAALAQADLSIAMGAGSDIAVETAMATILSSDLRKIPQTIRLSRLTIRTIRQNLFWAFIYNLISIPVAAGVFYPVDGFLLNPMWASAAMAFSSVSVVLNSLRLKRKRI